MWSELFPEFKNYLDIKILTNLPEDFPEESKYDLIELYDSMIISTPISMYDALTNIIRHYNLDEISPKPPIDLSELLYHQLLMLILMNYPYPHLDIYRNSEFKKILFCSLTNLTIIIQKSFNEIELYNILSDDQLDRYRKLEMIFNTIEDEEEMDLLIYQNIKIWLYIFFANNSNINFIQFLEHLECFEKKDYNRTFYILLISEDSLEIYDFLSTIFYYDNNLLENNDFITYRRNLRNRLERILMINPCYILDPYRETKICNIMGQLSLIELDDEMKLLHKVLMTYDLSILNVEVEE